MDDWNLDENHLISDSNCNIAILKSPKKLQGMRNSVGLTFGACDIVPWFTIKFEQDYENW